MPLTIGGKPFSLHKIPPSVLKVRDALDRQPKTELFYVRDVARLSGVAFNYVDDLAGHPSLEGYSERSGRERLWGNPEAIKALRKELSLAGGK